MLKECHWYRQVRIHNFFRDFRHFPCRELRATFEPAPARHAPLLHIHFRPQHGACGMVWEVTEIVERSERRQIRRTFSPTVSRDYCTNALVPNICDARIKGDAARRIELVGPKVWGHFIRMIVLKLLQVFNGKFANVVVK